MTPDPTRRRRLSGAASLASAATSTQEDAMSAPRRTRPNLAARVGRWSAGHWKTATFAWFGFVIIAFAVGSQAGTKTLDPNRSGPGESGRMDRVLAAGFQQPAGESVLVQSDAIRARDPAFTAAVRDVVQRISTMPAVRDVRSPLDPANASLVSSNGHAALVEFHITGAKEKAPDKV